eukprot:CAMPEP_0116826588 /NCGR_PEP_ID=MMETSP0418-20121206/2611_1 /TAXON_ID=1158023 /ORGANISM="Astrosyne radiata, Strain 13vi08-1A" /LENGTH=122 /DNA_ID=CAMNT_0004455237 /DNA_START=129 /DNA_END=497 /DNA_ORIENTATION=+
MSLPGFFGGGIGSKTPIWMRDYSQPANQEPNPSRIVAQQIHDVLSKLEADRLVMGHTPQTHVNAALQGRAWRIDVGASSGVNRGNPEVLEITKRNGKEVVSVLSSTKGRVPADERQVLPALF